MIVGSIFLAILILFCIFVYRPLKVKQKFGFVVFFVTFEVIITLLVLIFSVAFVVTRIKEEDKGKLDKRMRLIESVAGRGDYEALGDMLEFKSCFEKEFEVYWERALMYEYAFQYAVYEKAGEAVADNVYEKIADKYKKLMDKQNLSPTFTENAPYGTHFVELTKEWLNK